MLLQKQLHLSLFDGSADLKSLLQINCFKGLLFSYCNQLHNFTDMNQYVLVWVLKYKMAISMLVQ